MRPVAAAAFFSLVVPACGQVVGHSSTGRDGRRRKANPERDDALIEARSHDELVDAMRARKESLGLSNAFVDDLIMLAGGHCDKLLGPARKRGLSPFTMDAMLSALALKLIVVEDIEQAARMQSRWDSRDARQVRSPVRTAAIGAAMVRRARPAVIRELGRRGGVARWRGVAPEVRRELMTAVSWSRDCVRKSVEPPRSSDGAPVERAP